MDEELKKAVVTGVLVKNNADKFLLVKKIADVGPYANTFLTPGGGVNTGEPADEAARRELYEETGVKVNNLKRAYFDDDVTENWEGKKRHYIMLLYTANYVSGNLKPTTGNDDEFSDVGWYSADEMKKMPLSPPLSKLLKNQGLI